MPIRARFQAEEEGSLRARAHLALRALGEYTCVEDHPAPSSLVGEDDLGSE
jgi:hypothetical protein